jgi:phosphoribosyl 1,2-cyclic phosphodiesterase
MLFNQDTRARACTLVSGSSGNSMFIASGDSQILIDAGLSCKRLEQAMAARDIWPEALDGIFVTHEHSDHISGLSVLARRYHIPVYMTKGTWQACSSKLNRADLIDVRFISPNQTLSLESMEIKAYPVSHDAAEPVGYLVDTGKGKIALASDLGEWTEAIADEVKGADLVFLESNYDTTMLWNGAYPWPLKQRIDSSCGHLSNLEAALASQHLLKMGTDRFVLVHLSVNNNRPDLAYEEVTSYLAHAGALAGQDYRIETAPRFEPSAWHYL